MKICLASSLLRWRKLSVLGKNRGSALAMIQRSCSMAFCYYEAPHAEEYWIITYRKCLGGDIQLLPMRRSFKGDKTRFICCRKYKIFPFGFLHESFLLILWKKNAIFGNSSEALIDQIIWKASFWALWRFPSQVYLLSSVVKELCQKRNSNLPFPRLPAIDPDPFTLPR